ncbi:MAG TPA: Ig-like domain-containing protein [Candidatus Acidoferrum sp.]|nr:Ig-like domain-containing protein [Candidatus Acidoferrum sp.]
MRSTTPHSTLFLLLVLALIGCSSMSNPANTAIAPSITAQPASATVTAGQTASFTVVAAGTAPLAYQWRKNTANINGARGNSYTTPATTSADNGAKFDAVVSNAAGSMTSGAATLTVTAAGVTLKSIAVTPASPSIVAGNTQQFTATATYSDNSTKNITANVTWKSSNTTFATIGAATGLATGVAAGTTQITATQGSIVSPNDPLTVTAAAVTLQSIAVTPVSPSVGIGNTLQFTASGKYSDNSTKNITSNVTWASSNPLFATIGIANGLATGVAVGTTEITAALGGVVSPNDTLTVTVASSNASDVVTHHYDATRSGTNTHELTLTPANVNSVTFGKIAEFSVDGQIDGQILFLNQVAIPGAGNKNVLYFATENDSVYAVDASSVSGAAATVLWKTKVLPAGDVPLTPSDAGCGYISPVGVMSTPVIDRSRNAIYVVASSKNGSGTVTHRLHALNLATGAELFGGPMAITATFPRSGGTVTFQSHLQQERAALLESGGRIYTAWSGYDGDCGSYSGWVIAFSADTLAQVGAIDVVPNSGKAGIWLGGGGPAADAAGNVYFPTGNASGGNTPGISNDYGDTFVKLGSGVPLTVADYFAPSIAISDDNLDEDLGSAAALLLPDLVDSGGTTRQLAVVAGKDEKMYIVDRNNMGQYSAVADNIFQEFAPNGHENFSSPIYFNGRVYIGPSGMHLQAFTVTQAKLSSSPTSQSAFTFGSNGTVPSASANGTANGIVWALDRESRSFIAYDATDLTKVLYTSGQASGGRDSFANVGGHFITPMVANGRVYFGTGNTVAVFGLLP